MVREYAKKHRELWDLVQWETCLIKPKSKRWQPKKKTIPGNPRTLLVGISDGANSVAVSYKVKYGLPWDLVHPQAFTQESKYPSGDWHTEVHSSFVCDSQKVETTQMFSASMGSGPGRGKRMRGGSDHSPTPPLIQ